MKIITQIEKISSTYERYTCFVAEKNRGDERFGKFEWKMRKLLQNILRDVEERIMVYYRLADVVRELRSRLNMTQEELAAGICSVSSIAKIESGSQMPSGRIAEALFRRLRDSGCFFTGFGGAKELLELRDWEHILGQAKCRCAHSSLFEEQYYAYVLVLEQVKNGTDHALLLLELMKILVMSMPLAELYGESAKRQTYTYLELFILNSVAVQFYYMQSFESANRILERLYSYLTEQYVDGEISSQLFPVVCNNLAAVKQNAGLSCQARALLDKGIHCCLNGGRLLALPSLYGNLSNALFSLHETAGAQQAYSRMHMLRGILRERDGTGTSPETELLGQSYLMSFVW